MFIPQTSSDFGQHPSRKPLSSSLSLHPSFYLATQGPVCLPDLDVGERCSVINTTKYSALPGRRTNDSIHSPIHLPYDRDADTPISVLCASNAPIYPFHAREETTNTLHSNGQ
ncbi:uncharacterized protein MYCFIDRAFT_179062 [Pseudocercospora fijiensis CIRAD86]|uniref:Uncharacterized protein n=1 Tax=Pseudocercospora fijiensis (strain CIRAD86) TaxID=383855 RepID=M2ZEI5_PSEFD|nr:uncharacterized protein MYCFIDRAFT_179062 [Pseudocercospora fijiensis CIRAD86]EME77549.1 hypothetical protein MYCFIDRAFT_179062 [Pseudocercospora fijiensis CIRAD86]